MKKEIKSDPPEDIPAWFMTYSDVITLLMTFFILLLTFATTEPERFEKITVSFNGEAGSTGVAGHEHKQIDKDSWSQRFRPRAARIALNGSEMPPTVQDSVTKAVGRGLESVSEEQAKKDVMNSFSFELKLSELVNQNNNLTRKGVEIANKLSEQLRALPVHCAIEISSQSMAPRASAFAHHLYHVEKTRPGQVGIGIVSEMNSEVVRFVMERYES
ncbi:flagellar motor protein MotB [Planctomycetes bacterium K23_9]|uniref:Flagellar motor protein MotB n=1 Tax=Stieleria marina TaxID=1930275 RepID=A0A517NVL0_9BACT|nr:flagellar motor protein MotB [Planctomycetes bacterium K23_9]